VFTLQTINLCYLSKLKADNVHGQQTSSVFAALFIITICAELLVYPYYDRLVYR